MSQFTTTRISLRGPSTHSILDHSLLAVSPHPSSETNVSFLPAEQMTPSAGTLYQQSYRYLVPAPYLASSPRLTRLSFSRLQGQRWGAAGECRRQAAKTDLLPRSSAAAAAVRRRCLLLAPRRFDYSLPLGRRRIADLLLANAGQRLQDPLDSKTVSIFMYNSRRDLCGFFFFLSPLPSFFFFFSFVRRPITQERKIMTSRVSDWGSRIPCRGALFFLTRMSALWLLTWENACAAFTWIRTSVSWIFYKICRFAIFRKIL